MTDLMNDQIVASLRKLADDMESGRFKGWRAELEMSWPEGRPLNPLLGECPMDTIRHFSPGDLVSLSVELRRASQET